MTDNPDWPTLNLIQALTAGALQGRIHWSDTHEYQPNDSLLVLWGACRTTHFEVYEAHEPEQLLKVQAVAIRVTTPGAVPVVFSSDPALIEGVQDPSLLKGYEQFSQHYDSVIAQTIIDELSPDALPFLDRIEDLVRTALLVTP